MSRILPSEGSNFYLCGQDRLSRRPGEGRAWLELGHNNGLPRDRRFGETHSDWYRMTATHRMNSKLETKLFCIECQPLFDLLVRP